MMKLLVDLAISLFTLILIGVLFVGFSIFLGKYELLLVAFVLVGAASLRSLVSARLRERCECIPLFGEGLEIFNKLEAHYLKHQARSVLYYLFYPITSIFGFFFGRDADKRELGAYFHLIRWLIILLVIESATIYYELSQHFSLLFTIKWLYLELLCLYFLANFFMIPLSTLSLKLSVGEKRARLFITTTFALALLLGLTGLFSQQGNFYQIIPKNVVLEQRFQSLSDRANEPQVYSTLRAVARFGDQRVRVTEADARQQLRRLGTDEDFFSQVEYELADLLITYLPRWRASALGDTSPHSPELILRQLNTRLQKRLQRLSIFDEHELFYISLSASADPLWGVVMIPFRESILYYFKYEGDELTLYDRWDQLSSAEQAYLSGPAWDRDQYHFNSVKRLAQLVTEHVTQQVKLELQTAQAPTPTATFEKESAQTSKSSLERAPEPTSFVQESLEERKPKPMKKSNRRPPQKSVGRRVSRSGDSKSRRAKSRRAKSRRAKSRRSVQLDQSPSEVTDLADEDSEVIVKTPKVSIQTRIEPRTEPRPFIIYHDELREFDYQRALTQRLIRDHQGAMPELVKLWWTELYEMILSLLFWMFKLSMPLHILIILYCKVTSSHLTRDHRTPTLYHD